MTTMPAAQELGAAIQAERVGLSAPRFEEGKQLVIAGINEHYTAETRFNIPQQWHEFAPQIGSVPGQIGQTSYGVCWNSKPNCDFDYLTGVEVAEDATLPANVIRLTLPARCYAVFAHAQHVTSLPSTIDAIWSKWAPTCGLKIAKAPCFERYTPEFNPQTGLGGMEVWVPLDT